MTDSEDILIIGIGNEYRGDDEVGLYIARTLSLNTPENCVIKESPGEGVHLMNAWEGFSKVIIIDAVKSESAPGTIHRIDAIRQELPDQWVHRSAHTVSLSEAIRLARTLDVMPKNLIIYGIEGDCFEPGTPMSGRVQRAAETLIPAIIDEITAVR